MVRLLTSIWPCSSFNNKMQWKTSRDYGDSQRNDNGRINMEMVNKIIILLVQITNYYMASHQVNMIWPSGIPFAFCYGEFLYISHMNILQEGCYMKHSTARSKGRWILQTYSWRVLSQRSRPHHMDFSQPHCIRQNRPRNIWRKNNNCKPLTLSSLHETPFCLCRLNWSLPWS